jgi:hypothetical protein
MKVNRLTLAVVFLELIRRLVFVGASLYESQSSAGFVCFSLMIDFEELIHFLVFVASAESCFFLQIPGHCRLLLFRRRRCGFAGTSVLFLKGCRLFQLLNLTRRSYPSHLGV